MQDPGYRDYQDPRLQPSEDPEGDSCGTCAYYREVTKKQKANGLTHCVGACVFDIFHASTLAELASAELVEVDPTDEPCSDHEEDR